LPTGPWPQEQKSSARGRTLCVGQLSTLARDCRCARRTHQERHSSATGGPTVSTASSASCVRWDSGPRVLLSRLLSSGDAARAGGEVAGEDDDYALTAQAGASRTVFGWTRDNVFGARRWLAPRFAASQHGSRCRANRAQADDCLLCGLCELSCRCCAQKCTILPKIRIQPTPASCMSYSGRLHDRRSQERAPCRLGYGPVVVLPLRTAVPSMAPAGATRAATLSF